MRVGEVAHPERAEWGKPLEGVRILAVEQMQALPYATQLMAHLGADVVKVEHPVRGDTGRYSEPALIDDDGRRVGATYLRNNLSKRSIGIDLKQAEGRALFERLVPDYDVVAENFRAGTMNRLGLGYEALSKLDPTLIYVSISGFGNLDESPYASWPAYAPVAEAMAGLYEPNRRGDEPPPVVVAGALGDNASALFAVIGTLAALRHRERTGLGQHVDVAMYDAMVGITDMPPFLWSMGAPISMAAAGATSICSAFRARDGYFVVAVFRENHFARLAELLGHPEWCDDERFATRKGWADHTDSVIRPALEAWASTRTRLEACHLLCAEGIAAGPSHTPADLRADPHVRDRHMLIEVPRPDAEDPMLVVGNPVKMSRVAEGPVGSFPRLGEHTADVLQSALGLRDDEIAALRERGVIN
ncbi:MAG: CaiB/BaiF CoA-transferase family protein [Proteobacteria bacterium]|nr:CaiB/BaiF CoA-transferase family protein [Pseudomonadota bacterium]